MDYGDGGASDEEVNDVMRVQWATSHTRMERWAEEVELLQEEMRRVMMFLEWKSESWLAKQDVQSTTAPSSVQSGLQAYARKQAAVHHDLAVLFSKLWRPPLVLHNLNHSWVTEYMRKHGIPLSDIDIPVSQARRTLEARVDEIDGGSSQASTTQRIPIQASPDTTMGNTTMLLEEITYVEDYDEDEDTALRLGIFLIARTLTAMTTAMMIAMTSTMALTRVVTFTLLVIHTFVLICCES